MTGGPHASASREQPESAGAGHRVVAVVGVELCVHVADVRADGVGRHA